MFKKLAIFVFLGTLLSCGGESVDSAAIMKEEVSYMEDFKKNHQELNVILPSTTQIIEIFKRAGLKFSETSCAPLEHRNFVSTFGKSIAFGAYSADLAYCLINEEKAFAKMYFNKVYGLSGDLGLDGLFNNEDLQNQFNALEGDDAETIEALLELQKQTDIYLYNEELEERNLIFFTGAWIEGMYLASTSSELKDKKLLTRRVIEQKTVLMILAHELQAREDQNPEIKDISDDLQKLKEKLSKTDFLYEDVSSGEVRLEISDVDLEQIRLEIGRIRSKIFR